MRKTNSLGLKLIKQFEELRLDAYRDPIGKLTIGYGHLVKKGEPYKLGSKISEEKANDILAQDLSYSEEGVTSNVKIKMTDDQYSAIVSLVFNIGLGNFLNPRRDGTPSTILKLLTAYDFDMSANEFVKWVHAGGRILNGLVIRRHAERALFRSDYELYNALLRRQKGLVERLTAEEVGYPKRDQLLKALK
jgi:lysozyme